MPWTTKLSRSFWDEPYWMGVPLASTIEKASDIWATSAGKLASEQLQRRRRLCQFVQTGQILFAALPQPRGVCVREEVDDCGHAFHSLDFEKREGPGSFTDRVRLHAVGSLGVAAAAA